MSVGSDFQSMFILGAIVKNRIRSFENIPDFLRREKVLFGFLPVISPLHCNKILNLTKMLRFKFLKNYFDLFNNEG